MSDADSTGLADDERAAEAYAGGYATVLPPGKALPAWVGLAVREAYLAGVRQERARMIAFLRHAAGRQSPAS